MAGLSLSGYQEEYNIKVLDVFTFELIGFILAFIFPILVFYLRRHSADFKNHFKWFPSKEIDYLQNEKIFLRELLITYIIYLGISFTLVYFPLQESSLAIYKRVWLYRPISAPVY